MPALQAAVVVLGLDLCACHQRLSSPCVRAVEQEEPASRIDLPTASTALSFRRGFFSYGLIRSMSRCSIFMPAALSRMHSILRFDAQRHKGRPEHHAKRLRT